MDLRCSLLFGASVLISESGPTVAQREAFQHARHRVRVGVMEKRSDGLV